MTNREGEVLSVCILGTGWIGLALAHALREKSYIVACSASDENKLEKLQQQGFDAFLFDAHEAPSSNAKNIIEGADILVITYPPSICSKFINFLPESLNFPCSIYLSSSSVYPDSDGVFTEDMAINRVSAHSGIDLLELENKLKDRLKEKLCILRLAGLFGPDRFPGKFIDRNSPLSNPGAPVNLVHQHDVIAAIILVIEKRAFGACYNVCAPEHPGRFDFYSKAIQMQFSVSLEAGLDSGISRIISSEKLSNELGFQYRYTNPLSALDSIKDVL